MFPHCTLSDRLWCRFQFLLPEEDDDTNAQVTRAVKDRCAALAQSSAETLLTFLCLQARCAASGRGRGASAGHDAPALLAPAEPAPGGEGEGRAEAFSFDCRGPAAAGRHATAAAAQRVPATGRFSHGWHIALAAQHTADRHQSAGVHFLPSSAFPDSF